MFESLKAMGALAGLMKQQDKLKEAGDRVQQKLAQLRVTGQGGGGAVRVTMSGDLQAVAVELSPTLAATLASGPDHRAAAEMLIVEAFNDARRLAHQAATQTIAKEAQDMGLGDLLAGMGGGAGGGLGGLGALLGGGR